MTATASQSDLSAASDAVCRMGAMMLTAGTGSYPVKAAMGRVAGALGVEQLQAQVALTEIVATTRIGNSFRTQVVEVPAPVVNADRIAALMRVSLRAAPGLTAADLQHQLDVLEAKAQHYPVGAVVAGAAACAAFAFLNNGRWQECLAAAIVAGCGKLVQLLFRRLRLNHLVIIAAAATTACLVYMLSAQVLHWLQPGAANPLHDAAFTSAILFLVPGFPLLTAALDLARFDFTSGASRLLYASLITLAAALGAWLVAWAFGLTPGEIEPLGLPLGAPPVACGRELRGRTRVRRHLQHPDAACPRRVRDRNDRQRRPAGRGGRRLERAPERHRSHHGDRAARRLGQPAPARAADHPVRSRGADHDPRGGDLPGARRGHQQGPAQRDHQRLDRPRHRGCPAAGLVVARMLTDPAWITSAPSWTNLPSTHAQEVLRAEATRGVQTPPPATTAGEKQPWEQ